MQSQIDSRLLRELLFFFRKTKVYRGTTPRWQLHISIRNPCSRYILH